MSFTLLFNLKLQSELFPENTEQHTLHDHWDMTNAFLFLVPTCS